MASRPSVQLGFGGVAAFCTFAACSGLRTSALPEVEPVDAAGGDATDPGHADGASSGQDARGGRDGDGEAPCIEAIPDDPRHCGACRHDCLGGACAGDRCLPVLLADDCKVLSDLVVAGQTAYFMESGPTMQEARIRRASTSCQAGGDCAQSFLDTPNGAYLAADLEHLYFTRGSLGAGAVWRTAFDGTGTESFLDVEGVGSLALGGGTLFAVSQGSGNQDGAIITKDVEDLNGLDDAGAEPFAFVENLDSPFDVVFDGFSIFFSTRGPFGIPTEGQIWRADVGTTDQGTLADSQNNVRSLAVNARHVFWVNSGNGTVQRATRDGGQPLELQAGCRTPYAILVAGDRLVWTERGSAPDYLDGRVQSTDLDGGNLVTLIDELPSPIQLAQDDAAIYVASRGTSLGEYRDGKIYKVAKP